MTQVKTGDFVWHELMTTDTGAAQKFYGDLFGWQFQNWEGGAMPYTMFGTNQENPLGGVMTLPEEAKAQGAPPHWLCHVHVASTDEVAEKTKKAGGNVLAGPMDIPEVGRMAVIQDPDGGVISSFTFEDPSRYMGLTKGPGSFCWYELHAKDAVKVYPFYKNVFGWNREEMPMGPMGTYHILKQGNDQVGGIMNIPPGENYPAMWLVYIEVTDVDATAKKANGLGAKTLLEPRDIPEIGRFSVIQDPQGAVFAIYKSTRQA